MTGEFSELDHAHFNHRWKTKGRAYVFRFGVPASRCEAEWRATAEEVFDWADANAVTLHTSGQSFFIPADQTDYDRKVLAFKLRWC